jgi:hypothetical protein
MILHTLPFPANQTAMSKINAVLVEVVDDGFEGPRPIGQWTAIDLGAS